MDRRLDDDRSIDGTTAGEGDKGEEEDRTQGGRARKGGQETQRGGEVGGRGGTGESKSKPRIESSICFVDVPFELVGEVSSACSVTEPSHVQGSAAARHVDFFRYTNPLEGALKKRPLLDAETRSALESDESTRSDALLC